MKIDLLSKEQKSYLFDKMCRDNHFLQMKDNSMYIDIKDSFINGEIDLDDLVSNIMVDGSTSKSWDQVKKIVYSTFGSEPIDQIELLPGVKRILETLKELIDTDPQKLLAIATDQLQVNEFVQLIAIFKELKII